MKKIVLLVLVGLFFVCGCRDDSGDAGGASFEYDKDFKSDGLKVLIRVDRLKISVTDTLLVEFEAVGAKDAVITFPDLASVLEEFDVIDTQIVDDRLGEGGDVIRGQRIRLEPMVTGGAELPAFKFEYVLKGQTEAKELMGEPIKIEVVSALGEKAEDAKIADIEGVVALRDYTALMWGAIVGLVVLVGVVVLVAVIAVRAGKKANEPVRVFRLAHVIALERLNELESEGLVSAGMLKVFYEKVSNILRYYIEDRFSIKAPERTTEEFLYELKFNYDFAAADKDSLEQFLRHCDLVKFAKHQPDDDQVRRTVDLVRDFVDRTKSDDSVVEVSELG